jgi:hypothetical protein
MVHHKISCCIRDKKSPERGFGAGYANPATRYFVSDLKRLPKKLRKPLITFPIGYQP